MEAKKATAKEILAFKSKDTRTIKKEFGLTEEQLRNLGLEVDSKKHKIITVDINAP